NNIIPDSSGRRPEPKFVKLPSSLLKPPQAMSVQSLHGITLESLLTRLVEHYGWEGLGRRIDINCFQKDPSIKSSLKFLRRTPWAREQVEALYLETRFTN
ncbi:VF530 family DNA-binding protein, partial [Massilia varians]